MCKDMHYVPDVAAGIKDTSEPLDVADSLDTLVKRTAWVKQSRQDDLVRVTTQRDAAVENIEQRIDDIKQRLDELKVAAIAEVDGTFEQIEQAISCDIERSSDIINTLEKEERRLKAAQNEGESDLFVYVKQGRAGMREGEKVVQELEKSSREAINVVIDETVLACVTGLETFVEVGSRPAELSLAIEQRPTVRMKDDTNECTITDCCILDNGTIILTDFINECIKLFDKSFTSLDRCVVQGYPTAVCTVDAGELAITLFEKKAVQFATVDGKIRLTRSFSVGENCHGVSFSNNRLFISCAGYGGKDTYQVRSYDTSGALLQTIKHDRMDAPFHNMANSTGGCIVANDTEGLLAFYNTGKLAWQFQHADLTNATGLCEVDGWVLVCCWDNGHVFQVNPADQSSRIILQGSDELTKTRSLTYDMRNDQLIVTKDPCDHMFVCKISRK